MTPANSATAPSPDRPSSVSTPPNAMAHATGLISSGQMLKTGGLLAVIGLALSWVLLVVLYALGVITPAGVTP